MLGQRKQQGDYTFSPFIACPTIPHLIPHLTPPFQPGLPVSPPMPAYYGPLDVSHSLTSSPHRLMCYAYSKDSFQHSPHLRAKNNYGTGVRLDVPNSMDVTGYSNNNRTASSMVPPQNYPQGMGLRADEYLVGLLDLG